MDKISDNELMYMIYQGSEIAFKIFMERYQRNVRYWIRQKYGQIFIPGIELDDFISLGMNALCKAVEEYTPERGVFYSFAKICVLRYVMNKMRDHFKRSREYNYSLDDQINDNFTSITYLDSIESEYFLSRPELNYIIKEEVDNYLNVDDTQKKVRAMKLLGYNQAQIKEELNISDTILRQLIKKA